MIGILIGVLLSISGILWPIAHSNHKCPPEEIGSCQTAQIMEALMLSQIMLGLFIISIFVK